ncbi:uncharacterized protein LOC123671189 [Harmonia axyridis]|uniref:uncharacterized protein LOC123671189 n=1 Tax=Harmonia axyridis TaxID=115357 RepID=UPI001E277B9C|nr:uncharacterized protein LOC123671189 [Harmonia axyridis]
MALVNSCFCCGVPIAAGFFTVYLLIAYLIAFAFELLWILESSSNLPVAAVLLCAGYFTMALFAALLVHGLATKNTLCLIAWMFAVTILTFPEAGLVFYMSVQYWKVQSLYGLTELICWFVRIVVNVVQLVLVQSLFTMWKDEELVDKRLRELNVQGVPVQMEGSATLNSQYYQNNAYAQSVESLNSIGIKRTLPSSHIWNGANMPNNINVPLENYYFTTQSEFNASVFVPNQADPDDSVPMSKKSQSMMDLRALDDNTSLSRYRLSRWTQYPPPMREKSSVVQSNYNLSLRSNINRQQRTKLPRFASMDALDSSDKNSHIIRNRTGFYAQPIENYGVPIYYGPLDGPDFLIYKKQMDKLTSRNSLSNASVDDVQKYRDVAL